jgi:hypothetical protein
MISQKTTMIHFFIYDNPEEVCYLYNVDSKWKKKQECTQEYHIFDI